MVLKEAYLTTGIIETKEVAQKKFKLYQNQPNPFSSETEINYSVTMGTMVNISVLDINGKVIQTLVNGWKDPGKYKFSFNRNNLSPGIYYYRIEADGYSEAKKMIIN